MDGKKKYDVSKPFEGVIGNLNRRLLQTESAWMREELNKYQSAAPCEVCGGARLKPEALAVKTAMKDISYATHLSVVDALQFFTDMPQHLGDQQNAIAERIPKEIVERLGFLNNVGLDYLNLDRTSGTLSGGESQRIRLASQIGSGLSGVLYVLDEPSIGLHQRDNDMLLKTLRRLRDLGNTVLVVEHDEDAIRTADYIIDMGPGAGVRGGQVVAQGTLKQILEVEGQHHRGLSQRHARSAGPRHAAQGQRQEAHRPQRHREQPDGRHREHPARHLHLRHRCLGVGQVELHDRHALRRRRARAQRRAHRPGQARQDHRPAISRQGHRHRPVADRPHPAQQPRHLYRQLHADPRLVRRPPRSPGARLQARPVQLQRQGRPPRGVPGRRRAQDRDALPPRRLCAVRRLATARATTARRWR
ncbi:hypothetical protein QP185_04120 [Sphingomonas aerolata]